MSTKQDLRITRTNQNITDAFLALLQEKSFDDITVKDIAEKAQISRVAFYSHYEDKFDLLEKYIQDILKDLQNLSGGNIIDNNGKIRPENMLNTSIAFFQHIADNVVFYRVMFERNNEFRFRERVEHAICDRMIQNTQLSKKKSLSTDENLILQFFIHYESNAYIGLANWWLDIDMKYSVKQMGLIATSLTTMSILDIHDLIVNESNNKLLKELSTSSTI